MAEFLKTVPPWFLVLCALALGIILNRSINRLDATMDRFQELFDKVFQKHDEHEKRISYLEGKCETNHKD